MTIAQERGRLGAAVRAGNERLAAQTRARLKELKAENYIRQLVDTFPPLSDDQRDRLALLLRGDAA